MSPNERRRGPGSRADECHPTRHDLLDAAVTVLDRDGLDGLSIRSVTSEAGLAKGTFYIHFADRRALVLDLHCRFHDDLFDAIARQSRTLQPGPERARLRMIAFLDGCRRQRAVRALLLEARSDPTVDAEVQRRNAQAARLLGVDLRGCADHPLDTARLLVAATVEVARRELETGRTLPHLRASLLALCPGS